MRQIESRVMKVGYARVSTQEQDAELQIQALEKAGCEKIFSETASGAQRERPALQEALSYLREGDVLVVWKLDRLGRSLRQLIETVEMLSERGIGFISLTESIDATTAGGKMIFSVFGALAEFERDLIKERTAAGLRIARERGVTLGRPKLLSSEDIQAARALKASGDLTGAQIAKRLGVSRATLYRELSA